jgi:hypothetical protein
MAAFAAVMSNQTDSLVHQHHHHHHEASKVSKETDEKLNSNSFLGSNTAAAIASSIMAAAAASSNSHNNNSDTNGNTNGMKHHSIKLCRRRKARTVFSDQQLNGLEKRFESQKYLSTPERVELANNLGLSETQVII